MKNFIIVFTLAATAMAGVKDKDFMKMWPEYFEGLYGEYYPLTFVMDKNITEANKPVYEALDEAIATLWWFTMVRENEFTEEEEVVNSGTGQMGLLRRIMDQYKMKPDMPYYNSTQHPI